MTEYSCTDLKIVLILTILSVMFLFIPSLNQNPQNIVSYALLLLLLPGYSLFAVIKPSIDEISVWKRIIFSIGLGVILVVAVYLLWMYTPIMTYLTPLVKYLNPLEFYISPLMEYMPLIFILSTILTIDLVVIAWARRKGLKSDSTGETKLDSISHDKKERYLACEDCKGYYKLEEGESPEDFETCQCGGRLIYTEKLGEDGKPSYPLEEQEIRPVIQKRFYYLDLLLVFLVNIICLATLQLTNQTDYHTIIEFILILFLPGYALITLLYPNKYDLNTQQRVIYGFASSIAITALVGIILNYTSYKLIDPILYVLSGLTIIFLLAAYLRRHFLPRENRFSVDFIGSFKALGKGFSRETGTEKLLSLILIISVVLVALTTFITANPMDEKYTNFTVLGSDGNPVDSINLMSNETDNLTISIVNHENRKTNYRLLITSGGNALMDQTITLENEERKDIPFTFTVGNPGTREMEFNLYKLPDNDNPYKLLKIQLTVSENPELLAQESAVAEQTGVVG